MKNKKGFTLVELLAVLVVLALLMVLALPAVLNSSTNARKVAFQQQVRKYVEAAETKYNTASIEGSIKKKVYLTSELMPDLTEYVGCVILKDNGELDKAYVYGNSYLTNGTTRKQVYGNINNNASAQVDLDKFTSVNINQNDKNAILSSCNISTNNRLSDKILSSFGGSTAIEAKGTPNFANATSTDEGMYEYVDQDGKTYYFRGKATNNYVSFAGLIWRIVRINGDGSIRLILNQNITLNGNTSFKYSNDSTCSSVATIEKAIECIKYDNSNLKVQLESWFNSNITGDNLNYVTNGKFCNDYSVNSVGDFGAYRRLYTNKAPSLICDDSSDNGDAVTLNLNIGLLSTDEAAMAGGVYYTSSNTYLTEAGEYTWLMSPSNWEVGSKRVFEARIYEKLTRDAVISSYGLRPVINLKANVLANGIGTINNKYRITGLK